MECKGYPLLTASPCYSDLHPPFAHTHNMFRWSDPAEKPNSIHTCMIEGYNSIPQDTQIPREEDGISITHK